MPLTIDAEQPDFVAEVKPRLAPEVADSPTSMKTEKSYPPTTRWFRRLFR
jgi:hypothetical protein